jgi:hypothetical protein
MSAIIQFDIFETKPTEMDFIKADLEAARKTLDKVRKGTYASINELKKENWDLKLRLDIIERNICKGEANG